MRKNVKKYLVLVGALLFIFFIQFTVSAQVKIGYIDSQVILAQLPEAIKAQGDLDALINKWNAEADSMTLQYQQMMTDYQRQANTMPDDKKLEFQQRLVSKEQEIMDFRRQKFGQQTGEIYLRQEEMLEPVKQKIFKAIEDVAKDEVMQFVFDKSGDIILLYADSAFDITFKVLDKLKRGR